MSFPITVALPAEVLAAPPPALVDASTRRRDDDGVPDGVVLSWIGDRPFEQWSVSMLDAIDPAKLSRSQIPAYIKACDRAEARFAAKRDRATLLMAGPDDRGKDFRELETPAHELCVALRIPLGAAHGEVYRSRRLGLLPRTRRLYEQGLITRKHVAKITTGTGRLSAEECEQVEQMALRDAEHLSVHEFAHRIRRAVALVKPRTAKEQHDAAAESSDVTFEAGEDSMGYLVSSMPLVQALSCKKAYDHYALSKKKEGDLRPLGVLRAEAQHVFAEGYLTGQLTGTIPTHHGRPVEVQIAVTPEALLGLTAVPAEIPGVGPIPIETVREMIHDAKVRWLTVSADNGALLDRNPRSWRIPACVQAHADQKYVTSVGPHSTVPADRCDGEHVIRHPEGPTSKDNIVPMDRSWHLPKTHVPGMFLTRDPDGGLRWTTPLGQTVTVQPYDYRLGP